MFFGDRLAKALTNPDLDVRMAAIREIGEGNKVKYCRQLYDMLPTESVDVQTHIATALGMMTVPNSVGPLSALLRSSDRRLRAAAVQSMRKIADNNPSLGLLAPQYFVFPEPGVRFLLIVLDIFGITDKGTIATGVTVRGLSMGEVGQGDSLVKL